MTVSDSMRPDGERDEPWTGENPADEGNVESGAADQPIELTEEAARLDLDDDDPPLPWLQGDDEEDDFEGSGLGQTVAIVLLGLLAIGVVVGGVWWVMQRSANDVLVADGSTIPAPDTPYKQRPDDPGGKVFAGTGDSSFSISEGQKRPARLGEEGAVPKSGAQPGPQPGFASLEKGGAPAAAGTPSPAATPAADTSGVGVQVAAYSNREQAEAGWTRLSQQYEALSGIRYRIVQGQADIGTVYRLQAVAPDAAEARALCQKLKSGGLNCQVKN